MASSRSPNRAWRLRQYPAGLPVLQDFELFEVASPPEAGAAAPGPDGVVLKTAYLSPDPYMRTRMKPGKGYLMDGFEAGGKPIDGFLIAEVVRLGTNVHGLAPGDFVKGFLPWQEYNVCDADRISKIDVDLAPPSQHLGVLGLTGLTAYFSSLEIGQPKAGETALVSAAAGATGSVAGQIFKAKGCRVVGSAGSAAKLAWLDTIGFDASFNYKLSPEELDAKLTEMCPEGIDIYYDNVGGMMLDTVLNHMKKHGRIICCGMISQYSNTGEAYGVKNLFQMVAKQLTMRGFLLSQWQDRHPEGVLELSKMLKEGSLCQAQTEFDGFDRAAEATVALLTGKNTGKMVVKA